MVSLPLAALVIVPIAAFETMYLGTSKIQYKLTYENHPLMKNRWRIILIEVHSSYHTVV